MAHKIYLTNNRFLKIKKIIFTVVLIRKQQKNYKNPFLIKKKAISTIPQKSILTDAKSQLNVRKII